MLPLGSLIRLPASCTLRHGAPILDTGACRGPFLAPSCPRLGRGGRKRTFVTASLQCHVPTVMADVLPVSHRAACFLLVSWQQC